jgi:hypothetical protein
MCKDFEPIIAGDGDKGDAGSVRSAYSQGRRCRYRNHEGGAERIRLLSHLDGHPAGERDNSAMRRNTF